MPISDLHTKKAYVRGYYRAGAALRDRYPEEFAELLAVERGVALREDTTDDKAPGPVAGASPTLHRAKVPVIDATEKLFHLQLTPTEAGDLAEVIKQGLRRGLPVSSGQLHSARDVLMRLRHLVTLLDT